jgi:hypothetical protein
VVQEIDGLADILIGDGTHFHQKVHSVPKPDRGMEANRHSKTQGHAAGSGRDGHSRRAISGNRQLPKVRLRPHHGRSAYFRLVP